MSRQIGIFFLLVGLLCLVIFYTTIHSGEVSWALGFLCVILISFGIYLVIKSYSKPETDERFRSYRKYREKREEKKSLKKNQPK